MNGFCQPLDIGYPQALKDVEAAIHGWDHYDPRSGRPYMLDISDLRPGICEFLQDHGLEIHRVLFGETDPQACPDRIHIDGPTPGQWARLNWIYGNHDAVMAWYQLRPGAAMTQQRDWEKLSNYSADRRDVQEIFRDSVTANPTVVNTGVLHTGWRNSDQPRYFCQIWPKRHGQDVTFHELCDILREHWI